MQHTRLFTWWRLVLLVWILAAAGLWVRSYHRADGLNYRTAAGTHTNVRIQSGVLALEVIDETPLPAERRPGPRLWFVSADGVCDTRSWGVWYYKTSRTDVFGFIWIQGGYLEFLDPMNTTHFNLATARALAIPFWFLLALPTALFAFLLYRAIRQRHRLRAGHCPVCGYDLRASPTRCPECGRPTAPAAPP